MHASSPAKIGLQLGHSGRKGSTKLMWEGIDEPLPDGNWDVVAPSPVPYQPRRQPGAARADGDELDEISRQFVDCRPPGRRGRLRRARAALRARLPAVGFLSPVTNRRTDAYGGDIEGRLRCPLEVFGAMRAVWPAERPMTVRISATDWVDGRHRRWTTRSDRAGVRSTRALRRSTCRPGRSPPTNARRSAARTRRRSPTRSATAPDIPTIAVGVISSYDDVNSILLAGRADLCALGRAHLYDP